MTTLPICQHWTFSASGLLIQDWLLKPARPLDLTQSWSNIVSPDAKAKADNTAYYSEYMNFQIVMYFSLPLLPILTVFLALANAVHEVKIHVCHSDFLCSPPRKARFSHQIIVYFVLTSIRSSLTWITVLVRYIPINSIDEEQQLEKRRGSRISNVNLTHGHELENIPVYVTKLPAILTVEASLRLAIGWFIAWIIIDRFGILNKLTVTHPCSETMIYFGRIKTLFWKLANGVCTPLEPHSMERLTDNLEKVPRFTLTGNLQSNGSNHVSCHDRTNHFTLLTHSQQDSKNQSTYCCNYDGRDLKFEKNLNPWNVGNKADLSISLGGAASTRKQGLQKGTIRSVVRLFIITAFMLSLSLALCLPQLWAYQLSPLSDSTENGAQTSWLLWNKSGRALYEYSLATLGFAIHTCLLIGSSTMLLVRTVIFYNRLKSYFLLNQDGELSSGLYLAAVTYCVNALFRDFILILALGITHTLCWLTFASLNTFNRINCLLNTEQKLDTGTQSTYLWPSQAVWLWAELTILLGDVFIQLLLFVLRAYHPKLLLHVTDDDELQDSACMSNETCSNQSDRNVAENCDELSNRNTTILSPESKPHMSYLPHVPSDEEQTSQNISPLPISHTLSDAVIHGNGQLQRYVLSPRRTRSYRSNPSPYPSPMITRIAGFKFAREHNSLHIPINQCTFNEPCSSTVLLTYSPRSRHPCRTRPEHTIHQLPHNTPVLGGERWSANRSPPPLPPPPRHLQSMIGDSSIYSTPHGSPKSVRGNNVENSD